MCDIIVMYVAQCGRVEYGPVEHITARHSIAWENRLLETIEWSIFNFGGLV